AITGGNGQQIQPLRGLMMEAFVVFTREETSDPHALATYSAGVGPSFDGHDVTFLAAYGAIQHLEGPPIEGAVILRFPTMQAARDWYDSPAYQTIAAQRFAGSRYRAFIIEGRR
ncbi:DUF1330 domain-containing protein, partial [Acinetobacter ursingii]|uniref:DUF1330 domain-containing protein n=1 Tax=Acinetobacter ursingii TaxID=108980 RepID=UPI002090E264